MPFPTRNLFFATFLRQRFSLPDSAIYYILKNPKLSEVYQKLIQTCKYFFIKNPILVFHCLHTDDDGWKVCIDACKLLSKPKPRTREIIFDTKRINICQKTLSAGCRLWIQNRLEINSTNSKCASDLIPKIYQCDAKVLYLIDQEISLQQFLFYARNIERCFLSRVSMNSDAFSEVPVEEIVARLPNLERFIFKCIPGSKTVSCYTAKNLLQIPHFKNLEYFALHDVSQEFDLDFFYNYWKRNNNKLIYDIRFCNLVSEEFAEKVERFISEILEFRLNDERMAPLILFPGQDIWERNAICGKHSRCKKFYL